MGDAGQRSFLEATRWFNTYGENYKNWPFPANPWAQTYSDIERALKKQAEDREGGRKGENPGVSS